MAQPPAPATPAGNPPPGQPLVTPGTRPSDWERTKAFFRALAPRLPQGSGPFFGKLLRFLLRLIFWGALIFGLIYLVGTYEGRKSLTQALHWFMAQTTGAEKRELLFTSFEPQEITLPESGEWRMEVLGEKYPEEPMYRIKCPGETGTRPAYLIKVIGRTVAYPEGMENYPYQKENHYGALIASSSVQSGYVADGGVVMADPARKTVHLGLNLSATERATCTLATRPNIKLMFHRAG